MIMVTISHAISIVINLISSAPPSLAAWLLIVKPLNTAVMAYHTTTAPILTRISFNPHINLPNSQFPQLYEVVFLT